MACSLAAWIGCGKQPQSTSTQPDPREAKGPPSTDAAATVPGNAAAVTPVTDEAAIAAMLNELTQVVRRFAVEQRRVPKTLDELAATGYLSRVPQAPVGKKFAIDKNLQVSLVKR
jgi:hypothetical protein